MTIDFRCVQCGKLLRTPADAAGKQAQCPSCGAVQPIPVANDPNMATPSPSAPGPVRSGSESNPYAGASYEAQAGAADRGMIVRTPLDIGNVFSRSWAIAKPQIVWLFLFGLVYMGVGVAVGMVLGGVVEIFKLAANLRDPAVEFVMQIAIQIVAQLVSLFLSIGVVIYVLKLARGEPASFMDLFGGLTYYFRALCLNILLFLMVVAVMAACMAPALLAGAVAGIDSPAGIGLLLIGGVVGIGIGIYLWLTFGFFMYALVDRNAGIIESLLISCQITYGNRLMLFVLFILTGLLLLIGFCALCLPYLFAYTFSFLLMAVSYLLMSGQPTAGLPAPVPAPAYSPGPG